MRKSLNTVFIFLTATMFFCGCQSSSSELNEAEKEDIVKEVRIAFDKEIEAASKHNAADMMQCYWNDEAFLYTSNGELTRGWDAFNGIVTSIHSNPKYQSYTGHFDAITIRVLKRDAAMITGDGYLSDFPTEEGPKSIRIGVTYLMEKIDGNWLITVEHESTQEDLANM
jgi:uncharacterized protein (TIGR02246 family)